MIFRQMCPHWEAMPTEALLEQVRFDVLNTLMPRFADWYRMHLPLWLVLQYYGYTGQYDSAAGPRYPLVDSTTEKAQLSCLLPSHGGPDKQPSTRYYMHDNNDGSRFGHLFCFGSNCQKPYTSFWYLYVRRKAEVEKLRYSDVIVFIEKQFGVAFPRHILLDADPDRLDADDQRVVQEASIRQRFVQAKMLRDTLRRENPDLYRAALCTLYLQPLVPSEAIPHA